MSASAVLCSGERTTMIFQGWRLPPVGAQHAACSTRRKTSSGMGSGFRRRTARRGLIISYRACMSPPLSAMDRRLVLRAGDQSGLVAEPLGEHVAHGPVARCDRSAAADVVRVGRGGRRWLDAVLQVAGGPEDEAPEAHDAEIGRAEVLAGAVGDEALTVLDGGILLGNP